MFLAEAVAAGLRRTFCTRPKPPISMKFLNVAEKNDAAKTIAGHLSNGTAQRVSERVFRRFGIIYAAISAF